jgi:hypothetical protein
MNYYTEYWDCGDEKRNNEVISCINKNINSGFFKNIFIYSKNIEERINAKIIPLDRITYQFIFDNNIDGINILANSDIEFDETIKLAENIKEEEFYCLTRYEDNGLLHKYDDPYLGSDSQDVWIWKNKCKIKNANFFIGIPGCDNKIAYMAETSGYKVKNPAYNIKTQHKHKTNIRSGTSENLNFRLPPPYKLVQIGNI